MIVTQPGDLWYQNAIVYCIDVSAFFDSNGDGLGDFIGLTSKLDYLAGLGITCVWLMPFYPSPQRDGGDDITDYYAVDARLGSLGDFVELTRAARERDIRVIIDLVVQHTSDQHPWFESARTSRDSPYHGFYVWNDDPPSHRPDDLIFPGEPSCSHKDRRQRSHGPSATAIFPETDLDLSSNMLQWIKTADQSAP